MPIVSGYTGGIVGDWATASVYAYQTSNTVNLSAGGYAQSGATMGNFNSGAAFMSSMATDLVGKQGPQLGAYSSDAFAAMDISI